MAIPKIYAAVFLLSASSLAGCSEALQEAKISHEVPGGWDIECIGRLQLALPPSTLFAEGKVAFSSPYVFPGIRHSQAWGEVSWGEAEINETVKTGPSSLKEVFNRGKVDLRSAEGYRRDVANAKEDAARWRENLREEGAGDGAESIRGILEEKEKILKELEFGSRVTGVATTLTANEFAIRPYGTEYAVGYWDSGDQRIRTFKGSLRDLKPESPEAAANELRRWKQIYSARRPTEIPTKPGFCSSFGFFDESKEVDPKAKAKIPFRLKEHPNLLFFLSTEPASEEGPANILDLPDMAIGRAQLDLIGVKARHGADKVEILGSPGRVYAQEYGPNCASKDDCRPADQAYEIHAETFGEAGRLDRPHLILYMVAATSDEYKAKRKPEPGNPTYSTPERPALKGHVPPPYKVGREIFDQVLRSIRIRPGAISGQN